MTRRGLLDAFDVVGPIVLVAAVFGAVHLLGYDPVAVMQNVSAGLAGWLAR